MADGTLIKRCLINFSSKFYVLKDYDILLTGFFLQKLIRPTKIEKWAVVNFSARCDVRGLVRDLLKCGQMKGIVSSGITC